MADKSKSRVFIVDDHAVVLQGLTALINDEEDLLVCGTADSMKQGSAEIREIRPDIAIIDMSLGDGSGLDLIKELREALPKLPMLALSMHDEAIYAERAIRAGAMGYIMKKEAVDKVMTAIRRVLAGEVYVSEKTATRMVRKLVDPNDAKGDAPGLSTLSDREFEVFRHIARGVGPSEIAQKLGVSVKTVETHREHIKEKLGLKTGAELTRFCVQWSTEN